MKPLLYLALFACIMISTGAKAQSADTTITFKVKGITCATDLKMIEEKVQALEGVDEFVVTKKGATSTLAISFDAALLKEEQIRLAIEDTPSCEAPDQRPYKVK